MPTELIRPEWMLWFLYPVLLEQEAMVEIDVDQSDSVDFYEYSWYLDPCLMMKVGKSSAHISQ